jgi:type IV secretion system protein VirD4
MTSDRTYPVRTTGAGLVMSALGWVSMDMPLPHADLVGGSAAGTGVVLAGGALAWWMRGRGSTSDAIEAWSRRSRRTGGTATLRDHWKRTSAYSMRRRVVHLRPSTEDLSWRTRMRLPMTEVAVHLGTTGHRKLYASLEDNVLRVAGPRSGKTSAMAARVIDAPGGCVVTSTRVDLLRTLPLRAVKGPCHVYDPAGLAPGGSTVKWSPLVGCRKVEVAQARAGDMVPQKGSGEGERWDAQARRVLAVLMHAAALADRPMRTVVRWLAADGPEGLGRAAKEVDQALVQSPMADAMRMAARQYFTTVDRTRSSIVTTAMIALAWLNSPRASAIGDCEASESFDLGELIDRQGTLYIIGQDDGATSPLTGALVAELMRRAEQEAERRGGRLDPHLTMVLDEAAKVAPGPLHQWSADCGGRGILLDIAVQSIAAMQETWGPYASKMILANANAVLVGAGCKDAEDLAHWEKLSGVRYVQDEQLDADGNVTARVNREVPTIPAAQIAALEKGRAILYGVGPVSIVSTPNTWKRRDVRRALKRALAEVPLHATAYEDDAREQAGAETEEEVSRA